MRQQKDFVFLLAWDFSVPSLFLPLPYTVLPAFSTTLKSVDALTGLLSSVGRTLEECRGRGGTTSFSWLSLFGSCVGGL